MKCLFVKAITVIVVSLCMALAGVANAAEFEVSYLDGSSWNSIYAQGFSPSVSPNPNLGLGAGDMVSLTEFSFFKSGNADNNNNLKLAIISPFFSNIAGMNTGSSFLIGLSDNTLAGTAGIATNDPITFTFSNLPLVYGNGYGAVLVSQSGNVLTPQLVPALVADYAETSPGSGIYAPESNYGTNAQFDYAVSNFISASITGSYFNTFSDAADANFVATFTAVPEPSSALLGLSCVALAVLGRARRG
jgi:hypothetical protein